MKKSIFILTLAILGSFGLVYGQMDINPHLSSSSGYSVTNLTDYQSYGVNPANLGFESDKKFHFGLLEFSAGFYSEPLSRDKIFKDILRGNFEFGNEQKQTVIDNFSDSRVLGSAQVNLLGFSYQDEKLGGISFNIRERMSFNLILNNFTSEMLFLGYNADYFDQRTTNASGEIQGIASNPQKLSVLGDGSEANLTWTREFAVSYGRSIINKDELQLNLGGGIRYIQGFLVGQYYSYNNQQDLVGLVAASPLFNMDLGPNTLSPVSGTGLAPVGKGFGFDLGVSGRIGSKIKFGLAVNEIGSINWHGNVYTGANVDFTDITTDGIDSYNLITEAGAIEGIAGFDWENIPPTSTQLPTNLRVGGSYALTESIEFGAELYYPLVKHAPGGYNNPIFSGGGTYSLGFMQIQAGVSYNEYYGLNTPLAVLFKFGDEMNWEIGIGSRDFVGLFQQTNPGPSVALCLIRIGF